MERQEHDGDRQSDRLEAVRRARWSAACLFSALLLGAGSYWHALGETEGRLSHNVEAVLGGVATAAITLLGVAGTVYGVAAVRVGIKAFGRRRVVHRTLLAVGVALLFSFVSIVPVIGMTLGLGGVAAALFLAAGRSQDQRPQRPLHRSGRVGLSSAFALLAVAIVALGALNILVWNPLAKMPGMQLSEIYAAMTEADQPAGIALVALWAGLLVAAAFAFPLCCSLERFAGPCSTRRIVVTGLLLIGTTGATQWIAGFTTGMSLADTFGTSGGDATIGGSVLSAVALLAVIGAVFAAFVPAPWEPELRLDHSG